MMQCIGAGENLEGEKQGEAKERPKPAGRAVWQSKLGGGRFHFAGRLIALRPGSRKPFRGTGTMFQFGIGKNHSGLSVPAAGINRPAQIPYFSNTRNLASLTLLLELYP